MKKNVIFWVGIENPDHKDKYGNYNYTDLISISTDKLFITNVTTSKLSDKVSKKVLPNLFVGFVDFEVEKYRFPRQ